MKTLEKNIISLYGKTGKKWLDSLPHIIKNVSKKWSLSNIDPVKNMSWNFVALAMQKDNYPVVLKIGSDRKLICDEYNALRYFDQKGAIKVIDIDENYPALLLEQAIPGFILKNCPLNIQEKINIYAEVVKKLSDHTIIDLPYTSVDHWCKAIDRIKDPRISLTFIEKAKYLREILLNTMQEKYWCHGDLHLENIIQQGPNWLAIDPKGIIGEKAFEASAFDLMIKNENEEFSTIAAKIYDHIAQLSAALEISFDRLLSWTFLRIIISAQWFIEDNGDPTEKLVLINYIYPFFSN